MGEDRVMNKEIALSLLRKYKKELAYKYGVVKIGLFGSVARGTSKDDSDLDIVVELNIHNLFNTNGLRNSLNDFFGVSVDVVSYGDHLSPLLKERIKKEAIYV